MGLVEISICVKQHIYVFNLGEHINSCFRLFWGLKFYHSESNQVFMGWTGINGENHTQDTVLLVLLIQFISIRVVVDPLCFLCECGLLKIPEHLLFSWGKLNNCL